MRLKRLVRVWESHHAEGCDITFRQRMWLKRGLDTQGGATWRPAKRYRTAARRWIWNVDNQLQASTHCNGFSFFCRDAKSFPWRDEDWHLWPFICGAFDHGSDGVAASNALKYGWRLNYADKYDPSHGAHLDVNQTITDLDLKGLWNVNMIHVNLPHGPRNDAQRRQDLNDFFTVYYEKKKPSQCAIFSDYCSDIYHEAVRNGVEFACARSREVETWEYLRARRKDGLSEDRRADMCRFLGCLDATAKRLKSWFVDKYESTVYALEQDMLGSVKFRNLIRKFNVLERDHHRDETTSVEASKLDVQVLRSCCQNAVAIRVVFTGDVQNYRLMQLVVLLSQPTKAWFADQSRTLRDVVSACAWTVEQTTGGYFKHLEDTIGLLSDVSILETLRCQLDEDDCNQNVAVHADDEFADRAGSFVLSIVKNRLVRCMWLLEGWPAHMAATLLPGPRANEVVSDFKKDWEIYNELNEMRARTATLEKMHHRHLMQLTVNTQYKIGLERNGWALTPAFTNVVRSHNTGISSSLLNEEKFGAMKARRTTPGTSLFRKPQTSVARSLEAGTSSKRHGYVPVDHDIDAVPSSLRLSKDMFESRPKAASLDFTTVRGRSSTPSWYSPGASNISANVADLFALRQAKEAGSLSVLNKAWLGCLLDVKHKIIVRLKKGGQTCYYLGLHHWNNSACLVWPVTPKNVPKTSWVIYDIDTIKKPEFVTVTSLQSKGRGSITAITYAWRSWSWQQMHLKGAADVLGPAWRIVVSKDEKFRPLIEVAALNAFWLLSKSVLQDFATDLGIHVPRGEALFGYALALIKAVLKVDDVEGLRILQKRMVTMRNMNEFTTELLEIEEATDVLEKHDVKAVKSDQKKAELQEKDAQDFANAYRTASRDLRERAGSPVARAPIPPAGDIPDCIPHEDAKAFTPPDCYVWRGLKSRTWNGHYPSAGYARISRSWDSYTEEVALRMVLAGLWSQYIEHHALTRDDCPWRGLFSWSDEA